MPFDISKTIEPNSDQLNAEDFIAGAKTLTVTGVTQGTPEQPVNIQVAEYPNRAYRPNKTMRRVLAKLWGTDSQQWVGKHLTLYQDPSVRWAGKEVGGIRISHLEGLDKPVNIALAAARGKKTTITIQPLQVAAMPDYGAQIASATTVEQLVEIHRAALAAECLTDELMQQLTARKQQLETVSE